MMMALSRLHLPQNGRGKPTGVGVTGVGWPHGSPAREGEGLFLHPNGFLLNPANFLGEGCEVNVRKH